MKRFDTKYIDSALSATVMMWLIPFVLIIPNIILDITDYSNWLVKVVNILLPGGVYLWLMSLSRNVGRTTLLMFPFIFYAAFQVVLLYLYGESIIAIDMFLNLVTTSVSEASELLGNMSMAIITIIILYLLPFVWAIVLVCRHSHAPASVTATGRKAGMWITVAGIVALVAAYIFVPRFNLMRNVFPVNVFHNTIVAVQRTAATTHYAETSADFTYGARGTHEADSAEIYVIVIGETSRADNWQLYGYERETNPRLSKRESLVFFPKAVTQSNTTHKSVPLLLTSLSAATFGDSIYDVKSIVTAFKEAGFNTAFLSNQQHNHSFIDFFSKEADIVDYINDDGKHHYDMDLVPRLSEVIKEPGKHFVILHTYGSHFNYKDRFPADYETFMPDRAASANADNRQQLLNAYDNTIVYTDAMVDSVAGVLEASGRPAAMIYLSDHGEDIFDDARGRFLHASPVPTYYQIHVPMLIWTSEAYNSAYPDVVSKARNNSLLDVASSDVLFDTMLDMAGIVTPHSTASKSLVNSAYQPQPRLYLNDYNEGVRLIDAGLRDYDFERFDQNGISFK